MFYKNSIKRTTRYVNQSKLYLSNKVRINNEFKEFCS